MLIRKVKDSDSLAWVQMRTELWPSGKDEHANEIQQFYAGESIDIVATYVAENQGGEVCGFIELNIRNFAEGSRSSAVPYVEAWYIKPVYQGLGLGKRLMNQAELWARNLGYNELASDTELENNKSIAIHRQLGFKETERVVCFLKKWS